MCSYSCVYKDSKARLSAAPGHRTVQEGLSMTSTNNDVENEQSKHVLVLQKPLIKIFAQALTKPSWAKIWIKSLYVRAYVLQLSCCKNDSQLTQAPTVFELTRSDLCVIDHATRTCLIVEESVPFDVFCEWLLPK